MWFEHGMRLCWGNLTQTNNIKRDVYSMELCQPSRRYFQDSDPRNVAPFLICRRQKLHNYSSTRSPVDLESSRTVDQNKDFCVSVQKTVFSLYAALYLAGNTKPSTGPFCCLCQGKKISHTGDRRRGLKCLQLRIN